MSEHILNWLPAYHDGELSPHRRQQVENHLRDCSSCRAELQTLMGLSVLLKSDPPPPHTNPERFAAQVQSLLPHDVPARPKGHRIPLWMLAAPLALIVVWAFLQAALWVTSFVLDVSVLFPMFSGWFVGSLDMPETLPAISLVLLAAAVVLWGAWLAFWWAWKNHQNAQSLFDTFGKEV